MIKLLIADDESFIRQGIRTTIPWNEYDIEVVGEASNGREALNLSIQLHPDIVLADIQMPIINGLELAKQLNNLLPETKVIILSAYGNTENFTHAIEAKVSRFILKNANSTDILNNVLEVKNELLESRKAYTSYLDINNIYNENQYLIKSTLLSNYLTRRLSIKDFIAKAQKLEIDFTGPCYAMLLAECTSTYDDDWVTINAFNKAFFNYKPFAFFIRDFTIVVILNINKDEINDHKMNLILPELKPFIHANQLIILNYIESFEEFPIAYDSLNNCLDYSFWNSNHVYTMITPSYTWHAANHNNLPQYEKEIISEILSSNSISLDVAITNYYEYCKKSLISRSAFLDSIRRLILLVSAVVHDETDFEQITKLILDLETPDDIINALKSLLKSNSSSKSQMPQIVSALEYISQNYNKDLTLKDVGREVSLSVGYLSRIFKQETGYSFNEWINRVRIEKAKDLIFKTDLKYYEIAEHVGYSSYKYFAAYFKAFTGCSAKEYRNQRHGIIESD